MGVMQGISTGERERILLAVKNEVGEPGLRG
jgi:hypothetical protein